MSKNRKSIEAYGYPGYSGYQDILWLGGQVFENRTFMDRIEKVGFPDIYDECPYGDLTDDQKRKFESVFGLWSMRMVVRVWWVLYDYHRRYGRIPSTPSAAAPWRP